MPAKPKKCAFRAVVGKTHPEIPNTQARAVCLSDRQLQRLFHGRAPLHLLGCGVWACAWEAVDGKAVKITSDPDDVAALLRAQGLPEVVKIDEAFRLRGAGKAPRGLFALRGEKLAPLPVELRPLVTKVTRADLMAYEYDVWEEETGQPITAFRLSDDLRRFQADECARLKLPEHTAGGAWPGYKANVETCQLVTRKLGTMFERFARRGIRFRDMHHGNLGVDPQGYLKALDLGHRATSGRLTLEPLDGAPQGAGVFAGLPRRFSAGRRKARARSATPPRR